MIHSTGWKTFTGGRCRNASFVTLLLRNLGALVSPLSGETPGVDPAANHVGGAASYRALPCERHLAELLQILVTQHEVGNRWRANMYARPPAAGSLHRQLAGAGLERHQRPLGGLGGHLAPRARPSAQGRSVCQGILSRRPVMRFELLRMPTDGPIGSYWSHEKGQNGWVGKRNRA